MSETIVNEVRLYHEERGEGAPILCVHGTGSSAAAWEQPGRELGRLGRVIAYDRRGCTRSERPDPYERTSVAEHADDAAALLEALDAAPAIVIGRSYGGEVALDLALRHSRSVRALVLLEGAPLALSPAGAAWERDVAGRMIALAAEQGVDAVAPAFIGEVLGEGAWDTLPTGMREMFSANSQAILAELRGGGLDVDAEALRSVTQSTLLVSGADSPAPFRDATDALAAALPDARSSRVPGGHLIDPAGDDVLEFVGLCG